MDLRELVVSAVIDLKRNRVRTLLTALGILVGVFSVVGLMAVGVGFQHFIEKQFSSLGTDLVIVFPGNIFTDEGGFQDNEGGFGTTTFDLTDVKNLERIKEATYVVPTFVKTTEVKARKESKVTDIFASPPDIFTIRSLEAEAGQLLTNADERKKAKLAVLGPSVAKDLFGRPDRAVGEVIRIEGIRYRVKGVLKSKGGGSFGGPDFDSFTYLPFASTFSLNPDDDVLGIYIQSRSAEDIPLLKSKVEEELLKRYDDEEFSVVEQTQILETVSGIFEMVNMVLVAIAAVSLIVGGIGVMNIMYASVTERVKEIGVRRAIGATKGDILFQFLSESLLLSVFGGLMGIGLAAAVVEVGKIWFPVRIELSAVLMALGVSSAVGIFFGVWPARKAAELTPIEAIRKK